MVEAKKVAWISAAVSLILALAVILVLNFFSIGSLIKQPIPTITGVSQLAVFYLMAQLVERIVEPISNTKAFGSDQKIPIKADERKGIKSSQQPEQDARTLGLWCLASALGIVLCYFTVGLFQMVGVTFTFSGGHVVDAILSGIIVGSGTKPLHDLIGFLQGKNP